MDNDAYIRTNPLALNVSLTTLYDRLLLQSQATPLHCVDVYVKDFIDLAQGGGVDRYRIYNHLFLCIDCIFHPIGERNTACWYPKSLKKV